MSRKSEVLFEEKDPHEMYTVMMGEWDDVVYWVRGNDEEKKDFVRMKKS